MSRMEDEKKYRRLADDKSHRRLEELPPKQRRKKKRTLKTALLTVLVLLLLLGVSGWAIANHYIGKIQKEGEGDIEIVPPDKETFERDDNTGEGQDPQEDPPEEDPKQEILPDLSTLPKLNDEKLLNILLVGEDRRPGQTGRQRSDSMILCSINQSTGKVSLVSFLRDTYVELPGDYSPNRLNAAYAFGGFPMLKQTLLENFGVHVDGCFRVDFASFEQVIDIVGGVDIELSAAEAEIVGGGAVAGTNHLNSAQALTYARIRHLDSDFGRTARQRKVLTAIFNNIRHCSVGELTDLANAVLPNMGTDMSNGQIMDLIAKCAPMISKVQLSTYNIPTTAACRNATIRGMAVLVPDLVQIRELLKTILPF